MAAMKRADVFFVLAVLCFVLYRYGFKSGEEIVLSNAERNISTLSLLIERVGRKKNLKIPKIPRKCLLLACYFCVVMLKPVQVLSMRSYSIKELHAVCKQRGLSLIHQNIRGLHSNFESLFTVIATHDIDIITLSETHLSNTDNCGLYQIEGI